MPESLKLEAARAQAKGTGRIEELRTSVLDGLAQAYKTPLTAILAASAGLSEIGRLSPTQAELVALIDDQAHLLNDLTSRLLETARLDAKAVEIHPKPVGVEPMIDDLLAALKLRHADKRIAVDLEDDSVVLCCDRQLILMMLNQYIDNACKHSEIGTAITIRVVKVRSKVVFSVHNFGTVIPREDIDGIFDYYSLPSSFAGRTGCRGFGLSVAKRIALFHGGNVWVTSEEAKGTTFFAAIPVTIKRRHS